MKREGTLYAPPLPKGDVTANITWRKVAGEADDVVRKPSAVIQNSHKPVKAKVRIDMLIRLAHVRTALRKEKCLSRLFKVPLFVLALFTLCVLAPSCGSTSSTAQYRLVQTIPDAPDNLDISLNGKPVSTNVGFGATVPASGYKSGSAGSDPIEVFLTGTTTPVINSTALNLRSGLQSTVLLTGLYAAPTVILLPDNNTAPLSSQAEVRIIDASPSAPPSVDIYMVGPGTDISRVEPIISSLLFGQASVYISLTIPSSGFAQTMMIVTASGSKTQLVNKSYLLSNGQIRTVVLVDVSPGGGALSFFPLELNDLN